MEILRGPVPGLSTVWLSRGIGSGNCLLQRPAWEYSDQWG